MRLFEEDSDYAALELALEETVPLHDMRLLAYAVMPNHWHLVLWPVGDGDLSRFMHRFTTRHVHRWRAYRKTTGLGHVYQGRFKAVLIETDEHLLAVIRYVERNPLRANLVTRAEEWRWSSLWRREFGCARDREVLADWPVARPADWVSWVNVPQSEEELRAIRRCIRKGIPFGDATWAEDAAIQLGLKPP